jgi:hypothetical protein
MILGLGLGVCAAQVSPVARSRVAGLAPALIGDFAAGVYAVKGGAMAFADLFDFSRPSAAWKVNALGHITPVPAGEVRTGHHIWQNGKLVPAGVTVSSAGGTNLFADSQNLINGASAWSFSASASSVVNGTLAGLPAFEVSDQRTDLYTHLEQQVSGLSGDTYCASFLLAKQDAATSHFGLRLHQSVSGTSYHCGMSVNAVDGSVLSLWDARVLQRHVEDRGDHWFCWFVMDTTGFSGVLTAQIFPAYTDASGASDPLTTGEHTITALQLEEARHPAGYISTGASAVSVAGETLSVKQVALAKAVGSPGAEFVSNGDFADGLTDWTDASEAGGLASVSGGELVLENDTATAGIVQFISLNPGDVYILEFDASGGSGTVYQAESITIGGFGPGRNSYLFTADMSANQIGLRNVTTATSCRIDNVTLRQVTMPAAVSIALEGYMTYEDEDAFATVIPFVWSQDTGNRIRAELSTNTTSTGQMFFVSKADGVQAAAATSGDDKTPGVDVPFRYAFRHTVSAIQGASDGATTSVSPLSVLPDLIASSADVASTGNMTVTRLRIWAEDIDDTGLLQATA